MNFPHLSDTTFPDLENVNVYQFQNNFDYTRWNKKTKVTLCSVPWASNYADVVKFDTNAKRDQWFDSLTQTWELELQTEARIVPDNYVKLPIPYDVMARYNYLFIDMPIATEQNAMLDYETQTGKRRWYFFINDIQYKSPSNTQVYLAPDIWTNFQNDIAISYMLLERGHAPVAASDTDTYLSNPIANNKYLLAPDVNFDDAGITRSSSYVPFGNGTKYVCLASTCGTDKVSDLGTVVANAAYNPTGTITYTDLSLRYGHQLQVNGFTIGNGYDYSDADTPASVGFSDGRIANNLTVYAIAATEVYGANSTFFADILQKCPQFLTTVKGCFVVDAGCITLGTSSYSIAGHTFHTCVGKASDLLTKALVRSDFSYPTELQRFAKLYTSPYAKLEITDNDGSTYEVGIEETSTLSVKAVVSLAFPYINERVFVTGIGGTGSKSYTWKDLKGNTASLEMGNDDWFRFCFDWEIPTFALYMDGETAFQLETFNRNVKQAIQQSIVDYHNSMRSANTAYENACDQSDVAYTNTEAAADTARTNAYNSADTGRTNAYNSADTIKTNAYNSADNGKTNADAIADTAYNNTDRSCTTLSTNVTAANTGTAYNEEQAITVSSTITARNNTQASDTAYWGNWLIYNTNDQNIIRSTGSAMSASVAAIAGGAISGATTGAMFGAGGGTIALPGIGTVAGAGGGAVLGGIVGAVGGGVQAASTMQQVGLTTNTSQTIADAQVQANNGLTSDNMDCALDVNAEQNSLRRVVYRENASIATTIQNNSNTTSRANAADNRTTAKAVATNDRDTAKTNADNTRSTARTNADNTRTTSRTNANNTYVVTEANADRTRDNVQANAGYTRQVMELNAKETLENGRYAAMAAILDSRNSAPIEVCPYGGNPTADYMRTRGIQIKVKTQSDSAIRQTGAVFARFGYALNQIWDIAESGMQVMNHFTYWKASEIWVSSTGESNNAVCAFMRSLFMNGVTVWERPQEIGAVNVYDN